MHILNDFNKVELVAELLTLHTLHLSAVANEGQSHEDSTGGIEQHIAA